MAIASFREALKRGAACVIVHRAVPGSTKLITGGSTRLTTGAPCPNATIVRVGRYTQGAGRFGPLSPPKICARR